MSNSTNSYGGGIYFDANCVSNISTTVFSYNSAGENGGGILFSLNNNINIDDCNFMANLQK